MTMHLFEDSERLASECEFSFTRSSGPGGQHVNKVSTRVELRFDPANSALLTSDEKSTLLIRLGNRLVQGQWLLLSVAKLDAC